MYVGIVRAYVKHSDATAASPIDSPELVPCAEVRNPRLSHCEQSMVRLPQMLPKMLRYMRDRWLEFCAAPTEAPEELLNSGIGVLQLTREDESTHNPESLCNSSSSTQQLQEDQLQCTAELSPAVAKKDNLGVNHCLSGQSEKEEVIDGRELQDILSKLEVSQDYALLARQVRQEGIFNVETLLGVVLLIFDNVAMHPARCARYAQLCVPLSKLELPGLPGEKKITFRSVLLNTCQEEFEKLTKPKQAVERADDKEKRVKLRPLGNIKLIGELFNVKLLPEKIVHACIQDLLGQDPKVTPAEENVEALCHLFTTAGKKLEESIEPKKTFDSYFARLKVIGKSQGLPTRIRFMVRDVLDMRSNKWVPRREEMKTKTINEIPAEADAKLGLRPGMALRNGRAAAKPGFMPRAGGMIPSWPGIPGMKGMPAAPIMGSFMGPGLKAEGRETVSSMRKSRKDGTGMSSREEMKVKSGLPTETMALQNGRPAATPKLLPGVGGMVPGMSVVPSILGMPGGGGPVQRVDVCRKASVHKEALLSGPAASDVKVMESGGSKVAAKPKPKPTVRDHFGVRANKDDYNLRDLLQRVQMSDK